MIYIVNIEASTKVKGVIVVQGDSKEEAQQKAYKAFIADKVIFNLYEEITSGDIVNMSFYCDEDKTCYKVKDRNS